MPGSRSLHIKILRILLRPIARYCLKHALTIQDFYSLGRIVFIETADAQLREATEKVNASRISVLTGIYREDIAKIIEEKAGLEDDGQSVLARVIGRWEQDPHYRTKGGEPRVLGFSGPSSEFFSLVEKVSRNINPATVLFELERTGAVARSRKGLRVIRRGASYHADPEKAFDLVARDVESLIAATEENASSEAAAENLHIRTEYDNIYVKDLPVIREWLVAQGKAFHKQARDFISRFDRDLNPLANSQEAAGGKVIVQAFSHCAGPEKGSEKAAKIA